MDAQQVDLLIGIVVALLLALITWAVMAKHERQLDDPNDDTVVYLHQILETCTLDTSGRYLLRIFRQSGNPHKDDQVFDSSEAAIKSAISTLKRAKIDYVLISRNNHTEYCFRRPYHDHGGRAEGKKVGSVEIYKIE